MISSKYAAYLAPSMVVAFLFGPLSVLQGIYAKYFGVELTTIAMVLLVSRLFDAVSDPFIGYWSDYHYLKSGSRKFFVIVGGLLFIVSSYFLYIPVHPNLIDAETKVSTVYFLGWFLMFYLAWTIVEIPHLAWGTELVEGASGKNKIYSLRALSVSLGTLCFYLIPLLPFFGNSSFTPITLQWAVIIAGISMLAALFLCNKLPSNYSYNASQKPKKTNLWMMCNELFTNRPFLIFILAFSLYVMGAAGMSFTLVFIFVDTYLGFGDYFALLSITGIISGIIVLVFWYRLANYLGKKLTWILAVLVYIIAMHVGALLESGMENIWPLAVTMALIYIASAGVVAISPSLLSDIIDFGSLKFKADRSGIYFSIYTLMAKISVALGGAISLGLTALYEFDPSASIHTERAVFGLRWATFLLPALVMFLSILLMCLLPMNARRHVIIRRRLDMRLMRQAVKNSVKISGSDKSPKVALPS